MSIGELSDAFGLDASTLNRQTAAAMRAGLVERIPDPDGGMARKFRITDEGARLPRRRNGEGIVQRPGPGHGRLGRTRTSPPSPPTCRRFNTDIERIGGRPWPRP